MRFWKMAFFGVVVALGAFCFIGASFPGTVYQDAQSVTRGVQNFTDLQKRFEILAQEKGAAYAFGVLREATLPAYSDPHLLGHTIGDVLFKQKGLSGIVDCTQDFRNACSHAIVIGALTELGATAETIGKIDVACKKAPGGLGAYTMCYHGLGHGVFAYFEYDIPKTVAFCRKMGTHEFRDEQYTQCVSGAVMELVGGGRHDREAWVKARQKYFTSENPLSPCMSAVIPDTAKEMCLLYITPRLFEVAGANINRPNPAFFAESLSYCETLPKTLQRLREACFSGFGKEFVSLAGSGDVRRVATYSDEQYVRAIGWCELANIESGRRACIGGALDAIFWGGENDPEASFRFCGLVDALSMRDACYGKIAENIPRYLPESRQLCARLPPQQQSVCKKSY